MYGNNPIGIVAERLIGIGKVFRHKMYFPYQVVKALLLTWRRSFTAVKQNG